MKPTVMTFLKKFSYIIYNAYKTSSWKFIFVRGELHSIFFIGLNWGVRIEKIPKKRLRTVNEYKQNGNCKKFLVSIGDGEG